MYYIGPQLWAWRPGRMQVIKRFADRVLVIFPFEQALYERAGVPVEFVGHPLIDLIDRHAPRAAILTQPRPVARRADGRAAARQPPQRGREHAARRCSRRARACAPRSRTCSSSSRGRRGCTTQQFETARRSHLPIGVHEGDTDAVLAASDLVITASGTATVQTALHGKPMVIVYRLSPLTYRLGRPFVKVDTFGMVNLIAGRRVVPELIQDDFTPARVCDEALRFLRDAAYADERPRANWLGSCKRSEDPARPTVPRRPCSHSPPRAPPQGTPTTRSAVTVMRLSARRLVGDRRRCC